MLGILSSVFAHATRRGESGNHRTVPTHDSVFLEHERRKGEELHRQLEHERRYLGKR